MDSEDRKTMLEKLRMEVDKSEAGGSVRNGVVTFLRKKVAMSGWKNHSSTYFHAEASNYTILRSFGEHN